MFAGQPDYGRREGEEVPRHAAGPHHRPAERGQALPGGTDGLQRILPTDHAALRVGLPGGRRHKRRHRQNQRFNRSLTSGGLTRIVGFVSIGLLICSLSCRGSHSNPDEAFAHARSLFVHGDLNAALREAQQASRQYSGVDPNWTWRLRLLQAEILVWQGLNEQAVSLLVADMPSQLATGDLGVQKHLQQGFAYHRLGRARESDEQLAEAARLCARFSCPSAGELARARGIVELDRGHLNEAEHLLRESLDIARLQHDQFDEADALMNLGVASMEQEHYDGSVDWSAEATRVAHDMGTAVIEEKAIGNLGWAYYKLGDFDQSERLFLEAERKATETGVLRDRTLWRNTLGLVYFQRNQLNEAENSYRESLALAQEAQDDPTRISGAMTTLAFVSIRKGRIEVAEQYCDRAIQISRASGDRGDELFALLVKGEIAAAQGNTAEAKKIFEQVASESRDDVSLRWEAHNSLARLYEQQEQFTPAEREYQQAVATFEAARASVGSEDLRLPFLANATHLYDDYIRFLIDRGRATEALQLADYSRAQTLAEGLGLLQKNHAVRIATVNPPQAARAMRGVVLFYWLGAQRSYLWAITKDRVSFFTLPPAAEIETLVQNYRTALVASRDVLQTANADGSKLYDILVAPARALIANDGKVVVIPDGALNTLNFETLLVSDPRLHFWVEDVTVVNASSLRMLAVTRETTPNDQARLLLIGDPIAPTVEYGSLPNAGEEMRDIEKHFLPHRFQVYAREQATAPAYLASPPAQYSYIHFVAHGTASRMSPLESAIVLSRATSQEDSFKLYARDIIHQPLHAQLVTISTCYGAGARAFSGEGLVGLSWAFLRAGAHNVIGALWEVNDVSTPQLMDQLYSQLGEGHSPGEALRAAKLAMLHSDSIFRKPFYWAPFQLYTGS